jgi:hypothetical protein
MPAVDIDRQAIERRDFPIARRGYEPAAVDAHLRALAAEIEQLQRELSDGSGHASLAATAGTQVQSILAAAEATAADLARDAQDSARATRDQADRDAAHTREQAIAQARGQVAFVAQATAALLERVNSMDGEVTALTDSLRAGANRLAADLAAVETNMSELYDAAAGQGLTRAVSGEPPAQPSIPVPPPSTPHLAEQATAAPTPTPTPPAPAPAPPAPAASQPPTLEPPPASGAAAPQVRAAQSAPPPLSPAEAADPQPHVDPESPAARTRITAEADAGAQPADGGDLDGARLVALNMALNGESREDADRYLAENFKVADRQKLIDEVYAAIEG